MKKEVQLTREFKVQTTKAITGILFFIISYVLILLLAFVLTGLCIAGGIALISARPMVLTIALGIGLGSVGVLIVIFLLKFMFTSHQTDRSHLLEITESDEPRLFEMIRDIVQEVGTSFPKKVYLSSEVNASVFYDSSFWSMFLPVKKNLQIGLGLVNTITREELKAILAHEFGHFSQRTMKVGSYVYNVNQVIFNMLYDNKSYEEMIQTWANISSYFTIFVEIAVKINAGIQAILRKLYTVVNKRYLALSREMEFHADAIAASVTGYEPLKRSLLRMGIADQSFNNVLNFYNNKIAENIQSESIFSDQTAVLHFLSERNNHQLSHQLPDISQEEQSKYDKSKLHINNQWASHPSVKDRIERLEQTGLFSTVTSDEPANQLFANIAERQKQLTRMMFERVTYEGEVKTISVVHFIDEYKQLFLSQSFPTRFNGYYDNKTILQINLDAVAEPTDMIPVDELFSDEKVDWVYSAVALQNDIETLKNIANKSIPVKTFDYDGSRYNRKMANELIDTLTAELELLNRRILANDQAVYHQFVAMETAQQKSPKLTQMYRDFLAFDKDFDVKYEIYTKLSQELQFIQVTTPFEDIIINLNRAKPLEEELKVEIRTFLQSTFEDIDTTGEIRTSFEQYVSDDWQYFSGTSYIDENLNILYAAMQNYGYMLSRRYFLMKRALLVYQDELASDHLKTLQ